MEHSPGYVQSMGQKELFRYLCVGVGGYTMRLKSSMKCETCY